MKYTVIAAAVAASIMAGTLVSGKATVNFNHKPNTRYLSEDKTFRISYENGVPAIYLSSSIGSKDAYLPVITFINENTHESNIKLYLSGNGGSVSSLIDLVNTMKASPTKFTAVVYGDVYSAHAMLAMNADEVVFDSPHSLLLFHAPAAPKEEGGESVMMSELCTDVKGKDRGVSSKDKCERMMKNLVQSWDAISMERVYAVLLPSERERYKKGDDVIIKASDVTKRVNNASVVPKK